MYDWKNLIVTVVYDTCCRLTTSTMYTQLLHAFQVGVKLAIYRIDPLKVKIRAKRYTDRIVQVDNRESL